MWLESSQIYTYGKNVYTNSCKLKRIIKHGTSWIYSCEQHSYGYSLWCNLGEGEGTVNQRRVPTCSLSIYLSRLGYSLGELPLFGLKIFVRSNTLNRILFHIFLDSIWNCSWQQYHIFLLDNTSSPFPTGRVWIWYGQNNNKIMSSISLTLLTDSTWKLKTHGVVLLFGC